MRRTHYVWDGSIGNTSDKAYGPTVHGAFYTMHDMAITGTTAYYDAGYDEGRYDFSSFSTINPQSVTAKFGPGSCGPSNITDRGWYWTATDGTWVYFAAPAGANPTVTNNPNTYPGIVLAFSVSNNSTANFTNGVSIFNVGCSYPNGIYVGTQPGLSGMAVQQTGNLLAVSVAPDNKVYLIDKRAGTPLANFTVPSPQRLSFSSDGSTLWVISGTNVISYTINNTGSTPTATYGVTIPNFSEPLAVAVDPDNANLILVADGGSSQQIKAFNSTGASLWTYGLAGGYQANGPAVSTNKFWFSFDDEGTSASWGPPMTSGTPGWAGTFITFAPQVSGQDTFWIGDGGNHRYLHFSINAATTPVTLNYNEQIMYQPYSYKASVDQNNPSRVFNQWLEFNVDYTKPLNASWTLVNNWKASANGLSLTDSHGLWDVTTLNQGPYANDRTYALANNCTYQFCPNELVELVPGTGVRYTGIYLFSNDPSKGTSAWTSLGPDGSARKTTAGSSAWDVAQLTGFDSSNNPQWGTPTITTASNNLTDPVPRCCGAGSEYTPITTDPITGNHVIISFDQSLNGGNPSYHLGGVKPGGTSWLWKVSPAGDLNGLGNFEIDNGITYAANTAMAVDRNVVYGFNGEFFRGEGQASQTMHYYDDGLFVGQFGEASLGHNAYEGALQAFAGNDSSPDFIKTSTSDINNGDYFLWVNDESSHGPQRWHFVNARNIREQSGSVVLGGSITLTPIQSYNFPTAVTGAAGKGNASLMWLPVAGATLYNIYYSLYNGGPYQTLAGSTTGTSYTATGLTNATPYYFVVTAVVNGTEGIPSEQVLVTPYDTTQNALAVGEMSEGGQWTPIDDINSSAISLNQPSFIGSEHKTGVLSLLDLNSYGFGNLTNTTIGTKGYAIFDGAGAGINLTNISPTSTFTVTKGSGWYDSAYANRQFKINNVLEYLDPAASNSAYTLSNTNTLNQAVSISTINTINITVTDNNYHYLTVVSPMIFNNSRNFTISLIPATGSAAQYTVNDNPGYNHNFQFLFKGNVILQLSAVAGSSAQGNIQALFFDDAPTVTSTYNLSVNTAGNGTGTVTSSEPVINCGADGATPPCTSNVTPGAVVTLTSTPTNDTNSTFTGWTGACTNSTGNCVVTMNQAESVTANFTSSKLMYGDVLGQGSVTMYDADLTAQDSIGLAVPNFITASAKVDGTTDAVNIYDSFLIAEYVAGLINKFPVQ